MTPDQVKRQYRRRSSGRGPVEAENRGSPDQLDEGAKALQLAAGIFLIAIQRVPPQSSG